MKLKVCERTIAANKDKIEQLKIENFKIKQAANLNIFHADNLEQYSRRENIRIYRIPESTSHNSRNDGETNLLKIATALQLILNQKIFKEFIVLEKKYSPSAKPRPIIARFISYKKRNQFL